MLVYNKNKHTRTETKRQWDGGRTEEGTKTGSRHTYVAGIANWRSRKTANRLFCRCPSPIFLFSGRNTQALTAKPYFYDSGQKLRQVEWGKTVVIKLYKSLSELFPCTNSLTSWGLVVNLIRCFNFNYIKKKGKEKKDGY